MKVFKKFYKLIMALSTFSVFFTSFSIVATEAAEKKILNIKNYDVDQKNKAFSLVNFEDGTTQNFVARGGEERLTVTTEANHTSGGYLALKIENRSQTWHGPLLEVTNNIEAGSEYKVSAWVKLISPYSTKIQLSTQIGNGDSANYLTLASAQISTSDGWVLYEGTHRCEDISSGYAAIYVESDSDSTASFYIDDVNFQKIGDSMDIEDLTPIKNVYQNEFLIGNAISTKDLSGSRFKLLNHHFNAITAENDMKPEVLQPSKGNFSFSQADEIISSAIANGMKIHGHVLVWHQQTPSWMNQTTSSSGQTSPLDRETALINLTTHTDTVVRHFDEKFNTGIQNIISWDVVNEAINDNPSDPTNWKGALRQSAWYNAIGTDYIEQAFLAARNADPDAKLYYNDYNLDNQNKARAVYSMVEDINSRYPNVGGRPLIDGIGMQGHYILGTSVDNVKSSIELFASLGVEISITELDIRAGSDGVLTEAQANSQGYLYAQLFKLFKSNANNIARVTIWGLEDSSSWRSETSPTLFDKNLQAKPAYYGAIDPEKFINEYDNVKEEPQETTAAYGTPTIDGIVDSIWNNAREININKHQTAWQGATGTVKTLWDNDNLYILAQVKDTALDKTSANAYEQDSVEIFLDQNNEKTTFYQDDDGQFRVNYVNEASFDHGNGSGFISATNVQGTNYIVEMKIPFTSAVESGKEVGFDVLINDAQNGTRQGAAAWNDISGIAYTDTSVFGILKLLS